MKRFAIPAAVLALTGAVLLSVVAQDKPADAGAPAAAAAEAKEVICFESRQGASEVTQRELQPGWPNVKCSPATGATLWYGDPYDGTAPMAKMALLENLPEGQAVVRPRADKLNLLASCATACHNGIVPKGFPKDNRPVPIPTMEGMLPELKDFQHGRGAIWCLDCHHITQRNKLVNHFGDPVDIATYGVKCVGERLGSIGRRLFSHRCSSFTDPDRIYRLSMPSGCRHEESAAGQRASYSIYSPMRATPTTSQRWSATPDRGDGIGVARFANQTSVKASLGARWVRAR